MTQMKRYMKEQILLFSRHKFDFFTIVLNYPNWKNDEFENDEEAEQCAKHLTDWLKNECPNWDAEVFWDNEKFLLINRDGEKALREFFFEEFLDSQGADK